LNADKLIVEFRDDKEVDNQVDIQEKINNEDHKDVNNKYIEIEDLSELDELEKQEENIDPDYEIVRFIREKSQQVQLTINEDLMLEPYLLEEQMVQEKIEFLQNKEAYSDLRIKVGTKASYYYSENFITDNYATLMVRQADGNIFEQIAGAVRDESKIYPRPTEADLFLVKPFNSTKDEILSSLELMKNMEEYNDIGEFKTSNNVHYLYSNKYISKTLAFSLAEDIEFHKYETT
jgi:hypothetical protein